jgi:EmrB/QacA subfamily drug resistance transporter
VTTSPLAGDRPVLSRPQMNAVFVTVMLAMLMASLDQTIVSTALPTIVADVGGAGHMSWVITSYLLADTIGVVLAGKFGDLFGRKVLFQGSVVVFTVGSFFSGYADDMEVLISFRAVQGLGAGGLMVTATALIADVIPLRDRGRYQGALGAVFGVTTVAGPLLGGLFTDHLSWRWAFYVNIPIAIGVVVMASRTIPTVRRAGRPRIDYLGVLLVTLGASGLTLGTSWGGVQHPWASPQIIGLFVGSAVALALFVVVELRAPEPILPMHLFRYRVFTTCSLLSFVVGFGMMGAIAFLPTFFQFVNGASATGSGMRMLPMVAGILATAILSGRLVSRTGRYRAFPLVGAPVSAVGMLLLATMDPATSVMRASLSLLLLGTGLGFMMQILTMVVQNTVRYGDLGTATSGISFFRALGGSFGVAVLGTLYSNRLADALPDAAASAGVGIATVRSPDGVQALPAAAQAPVLDAYASSLQISFVCGAVAMAVALIVALFLPPVVMRGSAAETGPGDGFAVAESGDGEQQLETVVGRLLRHETPLHAARLTAASGTSLTEAQLWGLMAVGVAAVRSGTSTVDRARVGTRVGVPHGVLDPYFDTLVDDGLLVRDGARLGLTDEGRSEVETVLDTWRRWLLERLETDLPGDRSPQETAELHEAVGRIVVRLVREDAERAVGDPVPRVEPV